jgi:uncharacterized protein
MVANLNFIIKKTPYLINLKMKTVLLYSDTHSFFDPQLQKHCAAAQYILHAGDIGNQKSFEDFHATQLHKLYAVHGNIDDSTCRKSYKEFELIQIDQVRILLIHIAGSYEKYNTQVQQLVELHKPTVLVCGHSHICKVAFDKKNNLMYMNPGAAGNHGFHYIRTALLFCIEQEKISNLRVIELGKRGI